LFEQLCINFVNEKLQQIFIDLTLKSEQDEYAAEGIEWTPIDYFNNKIVCELIEGKKPAGIMIIMDEQCALSETSDEVLLNKLHKGCSSVNAHYVQPKIAGSIFTIKHYAGDVTYTCTGFVETNKDTLFNDLIELMSSSENALAKLLFEDKRTDDEKAKRPPTTSVQFRRQVDELMEALNMCNPHYVRTIKPNDSKKPGDFVYDRTMHQVLFYMLSSHLLSL
jgi:myosin-1